MTNHVTIIPGESKFEFDCDYPNRHECKFFLTKSGNEIECVFFAILAPGSCRSVRARKEYKKQQEILKERITQ